MPQNNDKNKIHLVLNKMIWYLANKALELQVRGIGESLLAVSLYNSTHDGSLTAALLDAGPVHISSDLLGTVILLLY